MRPKTPQVYILPNGLRAVLVDTPGTRGAFLSCFVAAGSRHDPPAALGTAHLLEHMLLRGSRHYPGASALDDAFYRLGARLNAITTVDYTQYFCTLPPSALATGLEIMASALRFPLMDEAVLATERRVVLAEMYDQGGDVPPILSRLYPGHPLGFPGTGEPEHVARLGGEELLAFHGRHYRPDQVVVVCAGAAASALLPEIRDVFGDWLRPEEALACGESSVTPVPGVCLEEAEGAAEITLAYALPELCAVEELALNALHSLLRSPPSGSLYRRLRVERGLVYEVGGDRWLSRDAGAFMLEVATQPPDFVEVVEGLLEGLREFILTPIDPAELELMLRRLRFEASLQAENPEALAVCYGEALLRGERPLDPAAAAAEVMSWGPSRLRDLAHRVFGSPLQIQCTADLPEAQWRSIEKAVGL